MIQRLTAGAFRIERRTIEPLFVVRCSLGVALSLIAGYATHQPLFAVAAAMGALSTGFASLQGIYRTRAATMLTMAFAMAFSTAIGMLTAHSILLSLAALAIWGFGYGIFASLGAPAAAVGLNATIALIVFQHLPAGGATAVLTALCVVAGGGVQTLLVVLLWPVQRYPLERAALADAYAALASYARDLDPGDPKIPPTAQLQNVRATLADPRPFGRNAAATAFTTLLTEAERLRLTLGSIVTHDCTAYDAVRADVASGLDEVAAALRNAAVPSNDELAARLAARSDDATVRGLLGQIRAAWRSAAVPLRGVGVARAPLLRSLFPDFDEAIATIRSSLRLDSPFGRHALRLAAVLTLCGLAAHLLQWQRGYWVALTAAIVLRPDFNTTLTRGLARIAGTVIGIVLSTALVVLLPNTPYVSLALAIFFATIGYAVFQLNYGIYSLTVTAYVVFLLALAGQPEEAAIANRLVATLCGGTLAMVSYLIWPTWESSSTRMRLLELLDAYKRVDKAMFDGLTDPAKRDAHNLANIRNDVWNARSALQESLERMLSEPASTHELDADLAVALTAATHRIGLANFGFEGQYSEPNPAAYPEAEPFARAIEAAMAALMGAVDGDVPLVGPKVLRDAYERLAAAIPVDRAGRSTFLGSADLLVDALNTCADLLRDST
jgi:uncharacterized membrane protein YccC